MKLRATAAATDARTSLPSWARVHAARKLVSELLREGDQITLEALGLADRALAVAERRMFERARSGP